jgi:hypothetical protein
MRKASTENLSFAGQALRIVAAASLAFTLAAIGCTTDRTPGSGQPQQYMPSVSPVTPSSTPGSEQANPVNPPMASSYTPRAGAVLLRTSNIDALADLAARQGFRGRVLGPADPGNVSTPPEAQAATGQFINPSLYANPEITVNSSISSQPNPVISTGAGSTAAVTIGDSAAGSALTSGMTANGPTAAAPLVTPASLVNNTSLVNPTISSGSTISPTVAANLNLPLSTIPRTTTTTTATTSGVRVTTGTATIATASSPIVIGRGANGTVTISNVSTTGNGLTFARPSLPANPGH